MENKGLEKAREYAFLLLKYRLRSTRELADRLRRKKFPEETIGQVISFLTEKRFIDDRAFCRSWIEYRAGQKFGARRIRQELRLKGIDPGLIDEGLRDMEHRGPEEETIRAVAGEKLRKMADIDPQAAKRRIYAYFLRRGFSPEAVIDVLNELI